MSKEKLMDCIPKKSINGNLFREDLKIIDFIIYKPKGINRYHVPVYILTDRLVGIDFDYYETMLRVGFIENCEFLFSVQERCYSKLEAYKQHKIIYKKLLKGFYDDEIKRLVDRGFCVMNDN